MCYLIGSLIMQVIPTIRGAAREVPIATVHQGTTPSVVHITTVVYTVTAVALSQTRICVGGLWSRHEGE